VSEKGDIKRTAITLFTTHCTCCHTSENIWYHCRIPEVSETIWHEDSNCQKIQLLKTVVEKSTACRCEHYSVNWQNYFYSVRTAKLAEWSVIRICVIITGNPFCSRSSTCSPPSCLQFCQMFTDLKSFFHWKTEQEICNNVTVENFTKPRMCSYTTLWFIVNH